MAPKNVIGEGGFVEEMDKNFKKLCQVISKHSGLSIHECSMEEFYIAYELMKEEAEHYKSLNS